MSYAKTETKSKLFFEVRYSGERFLISLVLWIVFVWRTANRMID